MVPANYLSPCIPMTHGTQAKMFRDGKGHVLKDMRGGSMDKVRQEWEMQGAVYQTCKLTAKPIELAGLFIIMEDLGESEEIISIDKLYDYGDKLLEGLKDAGVLHRDLRGGNIIIKGDQPYALDFGWARWEKESFDEDYYMLWPTLNKMWLESSLHFSA